MADFFICDLFQENYVLDRKTTHDFANISKQKSKETAYDLYLWNPAYDILPRLNPRAFLAGGVVEKN